MKIFISHSHNDKRIVDRLAHELINHGFYIWIDKYELEPNQSLKFNINNALEECSHFCIVLSKSSVISEWCLEELRVALEKEKNEQRVFVYPLFIDNCELPDEIGDRLNFNFRDSFDEGLKKLLFYLKKEKEVSQGTVYDGLYKRDYAIDWGTIDFKQHGKFYMMEVTSISFEPNKKYSIFAKLTFMGTEDVVILLEQFQKNSEEDKLNRIIIQLAYNKVIEQPRKFMLSLKDGKKVEETLEIHWNEQNTTFTLITEARILGELPDVDVHFDYGSIIKAIKK